MKTIDTAIIPKHSQSNNSDESDSEDELFGYLNTKAKQKVKKIPKPSDSIASKEIQVQPRTGKVNKDSKLKHSILVDCSKKDKTHADTIQTSTKANLLLYLSSKDNPRKEEVQDDVKDSALVSSSPYELPREVQVSPSADSSPMKIEVSVIELNDSPCNRDIYTPDHTDDFPVKHFPHVDENSWTDHPQDTVDGANSPQPDVFIPTQYKFVRSGNKLCRVAVTNHDSNSSEVSSSEGCLHDENADNIYDNLAEVDHEVVIAESSHIQAESTTLNNDVSLEADIPTQGESSSANNDETIETDIYEETMETDNCDQNNKICNTDNIDTTDRKEDIVKKTDNNFNRKEDIVKKTDDDFVEYLESTCWSEEASISSQVSQVSLCSNESPIVIKVGPDGRLTECSQCPESHGQILQEKKTEMDISFLAMRIQRLEHDLMEMKRSSVNNELLGQPDQRTFTNTMELSSNVYSQNTPTLTPDMNINTGRQIGVENISESEKRQQTQPYSIHSEQNVDIGLLNDNVKQTEYVAIPVLPPKGLQDQRTVENEQIKVPDEMAVQVNNFAETICNQTIPENAYTDDNVKQTEYVAIQILASKGLHYQRAMENEQIKVPDEMTMQVNNVAETMENQPIPENANTDGSIHSKTSQIESAEEAVKHLVLLNDNDDNNDYGNADKLSMGVQTKTLQENLNYKASHSESTILQAGEKTQNHPVQPEVEAESDGDSSQIDDDYPTTSVEIITNNGKVHNNMPAEKSVMVQEQVIEQKLQTDSKHDNVHNSGVGEKSGMVQEQVIEHKLQTDSKGDNVRNSGVGEKSGMVKEKVIEHKLQTDSKGDNLLLHSKGKVRKQTLKGRKRKSDSLQTASDSTVKLLERVEGVCKESSVTKTDSFTDDYLTYDEDHLQELYQQKMKEVKHIQLALKRMKRAQNTCEIRDETKTTSVKGTTSRNSNISTENSGVNATTVRKSNISTDNSSLKDTTLRKSNKGKDNRSVEKVLSKSVGTDSSDIQDETKTTTVKGTTSRNSNISTDNRNEKGASLRKSSMNTDNNAVKDTTISTDNSSVEKVLSKSVGTDSSDIQDETKTSAVNGTTSRNSNISTYNSAVKGASLRKSSMNTDNNAMKGTSLRKPNISTDNSSDKDTTLRDSNVNTENSSVKKVPCKSVGTDSSDIESITADLSPSGRKTQLVKNSRSHESSVKTPSKRARTGNTKTKKGKDSTVVSEANKELPDITLTSVSAITDNSLFNKTLDGEERVIKQKKRQTKVAKRVTWDEERTDVCSDLTGGNPELVCDTKSSKSSSDKQNSSPVTHSKSSPERTKSSNKRQPKKKALSKSKNVKGNSDINEKNKMSQCDTNKPICKQRVSPRKNKTPIRISLREKDESADFGQTIKGKTKSISHSQIPIDADKGKDGVNRRGRKRKINESVSEKSNNSQFATKEKADATDVLNSQDTNNATVENNFKSDNLYITTLKTDEEVKTKRQRLETIISEKLKCASNTETMKKGSRARKTNLKTRKVDKKETVSSDINVKLKSRINANKTTGKDNKTPVKKALKTLKTSPAKCDKNRPNNEIKQSENNDSNKKPRREKSMRRKYSSNFKLLQSSVACRMAFEKSCDYTWKEKLEANPFPMNIMDQQGHGKKPLNVKKLIKNILVKSESSESKRKSIKHKKRHRDGHAKVTKDIRHVLSESDEAGLSDAGLSFPGIKLNETNVQSELHCGADDGGSVSGISKLTGNVKKIRPQTRESWLDKCTNTSQYNVKDVFVVNNRNSKDDRTVNMKEGFQSPSKSDHFEIRTICTLNNDCSTSSVNHTLDNNCSSADSDSDLMKTSMSPQTSPVNSKPSKTFTQLKSLLVRRDKRVPGCTAVQQLHFPSNQ